MPLEARASAGLFGGLAGGQTGYVPEDGDRTVDARRSSVFLFFSNRLGCLGSLLVSLVVTALLIMLLRGL